ncbi:MAG TPA: TonB-dependent receptor plug domain-containing protein [Caulobacteraceae bacterium]|nr:TonB-dependent receptor plug domain-containing protein [Caulobacteraceae bacterium]
MNLQTAPIAATVISGPTLQNIGLNSLDDLQFHTPSLTIADDGGTVLFNIRGVGKDLTNVQTPSGVVTYSDGVASFPGFFQVAPYYDISNIEVLRGPQGTFAGQNADAGAVFITTNDPHVNAFSADAELQYGNYDDWLGRGYVNIPLGDTPGGPGGRQRREPR